MTTFTKEDFFQYIDKLTVLELSEHIKDFESRYGVSAAAAVAVAAPAAGGAAAGGAAAQAEEQTEFTVILSTVGAEKVKVIKVVREITNLGLKEAKDLVDGAPKTLKEGVSKDDAANIKKKFEEVGAKVDIK